MKELAARNHAKCLFVLIPNKTDIYPDRDSGMALQGTVAGYQKLLDFLKSEGISYLDLRPLFTAYSEARFRKLGKRDQDLYWKIDLHWSPKGNQLAGLLVAKAILEGHYLEIEARDDKLKAVEKALADLENLP
jgi:GTPase SAR1 family protein